MSEFAPAEMLPYFHKTRTCVDDMEAFIMQCSAPIEKVTMLFTRPEERLEAIEKHLQIRLRRLLSIPVRRRSKLEKVR